jgi:D-lactate dehydrogenase
VDAPAIAKLSAAIGKIVGRQNCLTGEKRTERFAKGFRSRGRHAAMVVVPAPLTELSKVLQLIVQAECIVIMKAANTGLTGGSTPFGTYDWQVVIISTLRLSTIFLIDGGHQIVSLPGGTLYQLEKKLKAVGREPHSVIGSSCIGASIVGGVCNDSGGGLVQRGPVYTELSLFARRKPSGELELVNHLGIDLGENPEEILGLLDRREIEPGRVARGTGSASNDKYAERVRDINAPTPARFNADPSCLFEAFGSAGKVAVFAVHLDTFAADVDPRVFYIGT